MIIKHFWKSFLWALLILALSAMPSNEVDKLPLIPIPHFDKLAHFILYFTLTALLVWESSMIKKHTSSNKSIYIWVGIATFTYGLVLEGLQDLVFTSRSASWADILANGLGVVFALAFYKHFELLAKRVLDKLNIH
jgi:VanZ family protein